MFVSPLIWNSSFPCCHSNCHVGSTNAPLLETQSLDALQNYAITLFYNRKHGTASSWFRSQRFDCYQYFFFLAVVIKFVTKVMRYTGQGKLHDHLGNAIEDRMCQHQVAGLPYDSNLLFGANVCSFVHNLWNCAFGQQSSIHFLINHTNYFLDYHN